MARFTGILIHRNASVALLDVLDAWLAQTELERLIVVDNGSTPEHLEALQMCIRDSGRTSHDSSAESNGEHHGSQDSSAEAEFLREVLARHVEATGSDVGAELLARWESAVGEFTKVMPTDYRRVLEVTAKAEADGLDADATMDAVMAAARA